MCFANCFYSLFHKVFLTCIEPIFRNRINNVIQQCVYIFLHEHIFFSGYLPNHFFFKLELLLQLSEKNRSNHLKCHQNCFVKLYH